MKRVYRLLRNNRESGPFTIGELLGQNLRPTDMLWIEGRSTAWCYLSEIELFPTPEPDASSKQSASRKKDDIESRAEEIRKKVMNFKPEQLPVREEKGEKGEMHYYVPITPADTIEIVDYRKQKSSMFSDVLMTMLIVGLFAGGLYGGRSLFLPKKHLPSTAVETEMKEDEHAAKTVIREVNEPLAVAMPQVDSTDSTDSTALALLQKPIARKRSIDSTRLLNRITTINVRDTESKAAPEQPGALADANKTDNDDKKKDGNAIKEIRSVSTTNDDIAKDDTPEKKGFFRKIFGKKKKDKDEN